MARVGPEVKRPRFPRREEAARLTRARIREVAADLFVTNGYVLTTVGQIALGAGVSPRTVFNAFPDGKAQLFAEALDAALGGDETRVPLGRRSSTTAALAHSDPAAVADGIAAFSADLYGRAGALIATYLGSEGADPEMRRHARSGAAEAAAIMQRIAGALHGRGALRDDLSANEAADVLLALCSPQVHYLLCVGRGWTSGRYRRWLSGCIQREILRPGPAG